MRFAVTILGNNSAIPANGRHPTAQVVNLHDQLFLVDCGEGTQMQMSHYKIKRSKINHIFISHLHGDHYFGLIGLLNSLGLAGRTNPIHIYGPPLLKEIIQLQLDAAHNQLPYTLDFHPLKIGQNDILVKENGLEISTFPTNHRIECYGFLFKEKHAKRKILPEKVQPLNIPFSFYQNLQDGSDYVDEAGRVVKNEHLTAPPAKNHAYAFCADTRYEEKLLPYIDRCDMIYHEATYLHDNLEKAQNRYHTTAKQAALLARKAKVGKLLIGHYSSRYKDLTPFKEETERIFPNTIVSHEGTTYLVKDRAKDSKQ